MLAARVEAEGLTLDKTPAPWESQAFNHEMTAEEQAATGVTPTEWRAGREGRQSTDLTERFRNRRLA